MRWKTAKWREMKRELWKRVQGGVLRLRWWIWNSFKKKSLHWDTNWFLVPYDPHLASVEKENRNECMIMISYENTYSQWILFPSPPPPATHALFRRNMCSRSPPCKKNNYGKSSVFTCRSFSIFVIRCFGIETMCSILYVPQQLRRICDNLFRVAGIA